MRISSLCRGIVGACLSVGALFAVAPTLMALGNPLFENAVESRNFETGLRLLIPKQWLVTEPVVKETLRGPKARYLFIYPRAEKGSRIGSSISVYISTIEGVFDIPARLRTKLSDADLVNFYIDRLARTANAFKVLSVRRGKDLGLPSLVLEYKSRAYDHYDEYTTDRFVFNGDSVYRITSSYIASRQESKAVLEDMVSEMRLLTDSEKRYIPQ
ncbi:MAG: hypothetical protein EXS51_01540 [Candidatus Taylorbacteria bacterium]|nr:hypothetical protein [Candidatus Taylorbacteria bacterium]